MSNGNRATGVVIRSAVAADLPELQRVFRAASLSNAEDRTALLARPELLVFAGDSIAAGRTCVALADGRVVGFASTAGHDDAQCELEDLFVDPSWQRRGIGRRLVEHVAGALRRQGRRRLTVTANPSALAFYRAAGFAVEGAAATQLGPGLRMYLDLTGPPA